MAEIEIGIGKSGRRAYGLDELTIIPSRRTRDPVDVDIRAELGGYDLRLPVLAAPMDGVVSPATAIALGHLGGVGVLDLEGVWTRYEDPEPLLEEIASLDNDKVISRLQQIYAEPIRDELIVERIRQVREAGVLAAGALTPQRTAEHVGAALRAELDLLVIRGTVVSAEHVSRSAEPLNLKRFIRELEIPVIVGGCASYQAALHLMRTGAAGVLVGVGPGETCTTRGVLGLGVPQATAIADARGARMRHLDETGVYVHLVADGGMATGGDVAKAIVCGADAVMLGSPLAAATEAPGRGAHWGRLSAHPSLPRAARVMVPTRGSLEEILLGPGHEGDGRTNLFGALRTSMATCGYESLKEFQKAEVMVATDAAAEGKALQRAQSVGLGR